ncbi:ABC-type transport system involved in resistance to organic solvents, auxiliary component [uncultured Candidatus Thioglobus sp.]|nr:ABC-type transport system involved in resistance to organic solvents, auxiliary component [uncultured Candidatus Thioglobus sp.]
MHPSVLANIIDPPDSAAINIMTSTLSSLKELKKQGRATPENVKTLIKIKLLPNIAIDVATRLSLKKYWHKLSTPQQKIFQRYITESLIKDYAGILGAYNGLNTINISAAPKVKRKGNKAIVKLSITFGEKSTPVNITLKMIRSNQWRVYDVVFSGVSLIKNYAAQFNSHIKRKGIDSLVKKSLARLERLQK